MAVNHAKSLLDKAETIFQRLDRENNLVSKCLEYIRKFVRMCNFKGRCLSKPRDNAEQYAHVVSGTVASGHESRRSDVNTTMDGSWTDGFGSTGPMSLNSEDMEAFQLFSAEMFDPIMFEGLNQSPWDGMQSGSSLYDGIALGL